MQTTGEAHLTSISGLASSVYLAQITLTVGMFETNSSRPEYIRESAGDYAFRAYHARLGSWTGVVKLPVKRPHTRMCRPVLPSVCRPLGSWSQTFAD